MIDVTDMFSYPQYIRVLIIPGPERLPSSLDPSHKHVEGVLLDNAVSRDIATSSSPAVRDPSPNHASPSSHELEPATNRSPASVELKASAPACIQASSEVIVPPVSPGNVSGEFDLPQK